MSDRRDDREETTAKLWSLIKDIRVAMMTTWTGEEMHARPMHGHQETFTGKLYFFTRRHSGKSAEIGRFDKLNLAYADPDRNSFVSVAGRGRLVDDPELMRRYWSPMVGAWFPKGLDDPELALIEVDAISAQYWDATTSSMRYLFEIAKANLSGDEPDLGETEKLRLR